MPRAAEVTYGTLGLAKSWPANEEAGPLLKPTHARRKDRKERKGESTGSSSRSETDEVSVPMA